ncbi:MAG: cellobiose transport system permease protein [Pseudonocardiales bacterium]|nr:cellobiose transport system permease protein [Pseudonocardiales bacterium]
MKRHVVLVLGVLVSLFPFYWMVVMATNTTEDILKFPPALTPGGELLVNVGKVFEEIDFFGSMLNTVLAAAGATVLVLVFDSLAAFTFAKFRFPGRNALFVLLLGTMMIPPQLSAIPQFVVMAQLGWVGSLKALVVPAVINAFGIFWMRQYISGAVPDELLEASRLDGCGFFRQYWHVGLPVVRPALAFLGIFTFISVWNDYLWPLVVLVDPDEVTLQVALGQLNRTHDTDYGMLMAGTVLAVIPLLIVFLIGARNFIADLAKGAVRG